MFNLSLWTSSTGHVISLLFGYFIMHPACCAPIPPVRRCSMDSVQFKPTLLCLTTKQLHRNQQRLNASLRAFWNTIRWSVCSSYNPPTPSRSGICSSDPEFKSRPPCSGGYSFSPTFKFHLWKKTKPKSVYEVQNCFSFCFCSVHSYIPQKVTLICIVIRPLTLCV